MALWHHGIRLDTYGLLMVYGIRLYSLRPHLAHPSENLTRPHPTVPLTLFLLGRGLSNSLKWMTMPDTAALNPRWNKAMGLQWDCKP